MAKSMSKNIIYSAINQIVSLAVPFITAPYIARVFSPELIGDYSYVQSNCSYFALLQCLGLALYGQLKAAKVRDDKQKLSCLFWEIICLKSILFCVTVLIYAILFLPFSHGIQRQLYLIFILYLIANAVDMTWFLNGLEEFRITAIRNIAVKVLTVSAILLFVRAGKDIYKYAIIMQSSALAGYCTVAPYVFKRIRKVKLTDIALKQHLAPSFIYFVPGLINTIFSASDKTMLGALTKNSYEVGVYEEANKICILCMSVISSISNVILPRAAYLFHNDNLSDEANKLLRTSLQIAVMGAAPMAMGIAAISDNFVPFFFGPGYEKSAVLLKILCFNVFFLSISNFCGQQCLIARGKQRQYNIAITVSALLNIAINSIVVYRYKSIGVSWASSASSMLGFVLLLFFGRKVISFKDIIGLSWKYVLASLIMFLGVYSINWSGDMVVNLVTQIFAGIVLYLGCLIILKDNGVFHIIQMIRNR